MKKTGISPIAWVLVGLLAIASGLISLGQQDQTADPQVESFGPSGVSAFAELLRQKGVPVVINRRSKPMIENGDIAVAFKILSPPDTFGVAAASDEVKEDRFETAFWKFIKDGGVGIVLPLQKDYLEASRSSKSAAGQTITDLGTGEHFQISTSSTETASYSLPTSAEKAVRMGMWTDNNDGPFVSAYRLGKGSALVIHDGIGITNRFIDSYDNAKAFSSLFSIFLKSHKRVVFEEGSFGHVHDPGIVEAIGPWANAAWQQLIFLGVVVVYTLGKRFGTPDEPRPEQRGSRELLDAIGDTFRRAKSAQTALKSALAAADADLRIVLKLPKDASRAERDRLIPETLQNALTRLQAASEYPKVTSEDALDLINKAEQEMETFIGPNRAKLRSLAKLRT